MQAGAARAVVLLTVASLAGTVPLFSQASSAPPPTGQASTSRPAERVRVPSTGANVHMASSSGAELLVVLPKGTVLNVLGRDKEWIQVELVPEMRKTGLVFRWYKNEDRGWMHDSTVEVVK